MAVFEIEGVRITIAACRKRARRAITRTVDSRTFNDSEIYSRANVRQRLARIKADFGLAGSAVRLADEDKAPAPAKPKAFLFGSKAKAKPEDRSGQPVAWNTGCHYTASGQRIAAQIVRGMGLPLAFFADADRGITGVVVIGDSVTRATLRSVVDAAYLRNEYRMPSGFDEHRICEVLRRYAVDHAPEIS